MYIHLFTPKKSRSNFDIELLQDGGRAGLGIFPARQGFAGQGQTRAGDGHLPNAAVGIAGELHEFPFFQRPEISGQGCAFDAEELGEARDRDRVGLDQGGQDRELRSPQAGAAELFFKMPRERPAGAAQGRASAFSAGDELLLNLVHDKCIYTYCSVKSRSRFDDDPKI